MEFGPVIWRLGRRHGPWLEGQANDAAESCDDVEGYVLGDVMFCLGTKHCGAV